MSNQQSLTEAAVSSAPRRTEHRVSPAARLLLCTPKREQVPVTTTRSCLVLCERQASANGDARMRIGGMLIHRLRRTRAGLASSHRSLARCGVGPVEAVVL